MDEGWVNSGGSGRLEVVLLARDHGIGCLVIPQVCGPDRSLQVIVGIGSEVLVVV